MFRYAVLCLAALSACATTSVPYSDRCTNPSKPCTLSYDFEPSGAARDVFSKESDHYLLLNEDGLVFSWTLNEKDAWDHDNVTFVRALEGVQKLESAASAICDGTPVFLAATNFAPGRKGPSPKRQRVAAVVGSIEAPVRILEQTSALISSLAARSGAAALKIEGLALSQDCRTLYVGVRSTLDKSGAERFVTDIHTINLDVDWKGMRETASLAESTTLKAEPTCSAQAEGISSLEVLRDGSLLALTSFERETRPRNKPEEIATAELSGSMWKRKPDGTVTRLACFPGHKPEALAVSADELVARVIFEDDDYGGRPVPVGAVKVKLP
jgi:hypothetical protein